MSAIGKHRSPQEARRQLRDLGGLRLTANAAQLSLRDLRLRPLRAMPQPPQTTQFESPLEDALQKYVETVDVE